MAILVVVLMVIVLIVAMVVTVIVVERRRCGHVAVVAAATAAEAGVVEEWVVVVVAVAAAVAFPSPSERSASNRSQETWLFHRYIPLEPLQIPITLLITEHGKTEFPKFRSNVRIPKSANSNVLLKVHVALPDSEVELCVLGTVAVATVVRGASAQDCMIPSGFRRVG